MYYLHSLLTTHNYEQDNEDESYIKQSSSSKHRGRVEHVGNNWADIFHRTHFIINLIYHRFTVFVF